MLLRTAIVIVSIIFFVGIPVRATDSEIRATVCAAGSVSDITLNASQDEERTVRISGSVKQSPYIDIFIDGRKHDRIYFVGTDTEYFTTAPITSGTHLIQAFIYDACTDSMLVSETTVTIPLIPQNPSSKSSNSSNQTSQQVLGSLSLIDAPRIFYDDRSKIYQQVTIDQIIMTPFPWWLFFSFGAALLILLVIYLLYIWRDMLHAKAIRGRFWARARIVIYLLCVTLIFIVVAIFLQAL